MLCILVSDVNECVENLDQCSNNATCLNTMGSYTCSCDQGYEGNGFNCTGKEFFILFIDSSFSSLLSCRY